MTGTDHFDAICVMMVSAIWHVRLCILLFVLDGWHRLSVDGHAVLCCGWRGREPAQARRGEK